MNKLLYLINYILRIKKKKIITFIFISSIASISEMISLSLIIPFLSSLTNPNSINENNTFLFINQFFNLNSNSETISLLAIIICLTTIFTNIVRALSLRYSAKTNAEITNVLSLNAFENYIHSPYLDQIEINSGDLITKFNYFNKLFSGILIPISFLINYSITIFGILVVLISSSPKGGTIVILISLLFYLIIIISTKNKIKNLSKIVGNSNLLHTRKLQEVIGGIKEINLKNNYKFYEDKYREIDFKMRSSTAEVIFLNGIPKFLIEGFGLSFIFCFLAIYSSNNEINTILPKIGLMAIAFQKIIPAFQSIYISFNSLRSNSYLLDAFEELLNKQRLRKFYYQKNLRSKSIFQEKVIIESLSFTYPKDKEIINNFNFEIIKGDIIGIIGKTGCGKSTLIDLLLLLLKPSKGKIIIDGKDISNNIKMQKKWQSIISHVPQDVFLDETTIKNNIAFGIKDEDIDLTQLKKSAKIAQIHDYINNLPFKYNTLIGERGINISGGQRQRIGIARCLYHKPEVIILDEATSALDNKTEDEFIKELTKEKNITVIMVAHRLRSLEKCNKIINLSK